MNKLFVGNRDDSTSSSDLERVFGQHGQVAPTVVGSDRYTANSRGFGFVEYVSGDAAERALSGLQGVDLHGRPLVVNVACERRLGAR